MYFQGMSEPEAGAIFARQRLWLQVGLAPQWTDTDTFATTPRRPASLQRRYGNRSKLQHVLVVSKI